MGDLVVIRSLWSDRERARIGSRRWFILCAKRILRAPALIETALQRFRYRRLGVDVGKLTILQGLRVDGPATNLSIGCNTFVGLDVHVACHASVRIGDLVCINSGARILSASHDVGDPQWRSFSKPIVIRNHAWIATGAVILPGVTIGTGAVVGAGAVVARDVPDFAIVVGNPARQLEARRPTRLSYDPVAFAAPFEAWVGKSTIVPEIGKGAS